MRIDHVAIWTSNLERLRAFYERYFGARSSEKYVNPVKRFSSYFLSFDDGARLEIMHQEDVSNPNSGLGLGYAHIALGVGTEADVDRLTVQLNADGYAVVDGPRRTGDGYYESVVIDPDGNRIELTVG